MAIHEDQDGDAQQFLERERRMQTTAAASADEQMLRATAAGLWRQLQADYQRFTEGIAIDEASFSLNAVALGRTVALAQTIRDEATNTAAIAA